MPKDTGAIPPSITEISNGKNRPTAEQKDLKILLRRIEEEKTKDDQQIIKLVDVATNNLLLKYYSTRQVKLDVLNKIHFLPKDAFENIFGLNVKEGGAIATYRKEIEEIALVRLRSLLRRAEVIFHEVIHLKTHRHIRNKQGVEEERVGFQTIDPQNGDRSVDLNEAIVHKLTLEFYEQTLKVNNIFSHESKELEDVRKEYLDKAKTFNEKVTAQYILCIEPDEKEEENIISVDEPGRLVGLETLLNRVVEAKPEQWPDKESLWEFIKQCYFTANKEAVKQAVDEALGDGNFAKIETGEWFKNI